MKFLFALPMLALALAACNGAKKNAVTDEQFEKELQAKFINAKEGEVIELPEGTYHLSRSLILDGVRNVTIRGKGREKTILSFKNQKDGAEGIRATADGVVFEDFTILDAKGDCIKVQDANNVVFRRLKVGWTSLHDTKNGSYGTYPVGCNGVLIEDCEVFGSSDAGIYVGQSKNIIVRRNYVHDNVAGIEIENSTDADVYENTSTNNTGGMLVFDLPDLPVKNGARCRVYNNRFTNNNVRNFAVKGTTVAEIPAGTGVIIMATNDCEIFNNEIANNNSVSVAIVSYTSLNRPTKDTLYDPYSGGIYVHDNRITRGTGKPDNTVLFGKLFAALFGDKVPDILYDGEVNPAYRSSNGQVKNEYRICLRNNGNVTFCNMDLANKGKNKSYDVSKFDCALPALNPVKLNL
ncbi:MAG: right-handed parallel beta-helix repeat-containing protein [Chitinophagales bacterium]|nr:right-handed parallel beta-helix repeat-containing protein [Chitinophagales bacterium]MDW8418077.1 parallel beta-helix domain-containing protein [Chitinophagales bacterium]